MIRSAMMLLLVAMMLSGCAYPIKQTHTVDDRPTIFVANPPSGAMLYVDGVEIGPAVEYNGDPNVLLLEPGTHRVEVRTGGQTLYSSDLFLGEGTQRKISLPSQGR